MNSDRLYELAFRYKKTKLWKKLWDSDMFAVKLDDGETAYVSIMGKGGTYCGIGIYIGDEGYRSYRRLSGFQPELMASEFEMQEMAVSQRCYHLSLDGKDDLEPEEVAEVRAYAKAHGIRLAGKNAYPHFLKFEPNCYPWHLMTERDESYVWQAVSATLRVAELLEHASPAELGLDSGEIPATHFPVMDLESGRYELAGQINAPKLKKVPFAKPRSLNDIGIRSLKKCKNRGTFECEIIILPTPIQEDPEQAPYLPHILMTVERESHFILPPLPMKNYEDRAEEMVNHFIKMLQEHGVCPDQLLVRDERTFAMLERLAKKLSVPIRIEEELDALDDAQDSFLEYMDGDGDDEIDEEQMMNDMLGFIQMLLTLDDDEIEQLPPELMEQLEMLLDSGALPAEIARELEDRFDL